MRGWKRSMLWPDTGLKWVPTSPAIPSPAAAFGYSMTGLGCQAGGFQHGYGTQYPFRMLTFPNKTPKQIEAELRKADIPGLSYRPVSAKDKKGKSVDGLYVLINDWNKVNPTEISFHLMRITCKFNGGNIFRHLPEQQALLFNKHTGSEAWWRELYTKAPMPMLKSLSPNGKETTPPSKNLSKNSASTIEANDNKVKRQTHELRHRKNSPAISGTCGKNKIRQADCLFRQRRNIP
ncbi:MAG: hypothetical protein ACLUKN_03040 [Bacilli bacterium]